jgi:hypothetical protein
MSKFEQWLTRLLVDPDRREEILGDLEEARTTRGALGHYRDLASVCLRQSRLGWRHAVGVVALLGLATSLWHTSPVKTVAAQDDAGRFTLRFVGRDVVGATLDGEEVPRRRILRDGELLIIRDARGAEALRLRILGASTFTWKGRPPSSDSSRVPS